MIRTFDSKLQGTAERLRSPVVRGARAAAGHLGRAVLLLVTLCLLPSFADSSGSDQPTEYQVKAAFLYNFAKFTEWPKEAFEKKNSPFVVGIVGKDPFGKYLDGAFKKKKKGEHPIEIRRFAKVADVKGCHILFVPKAEAKNIEAITKSLAKQHVLIVGETTDLAKKGASINFYMGDAKVRFEINPSAAERKKLKISSKLLKLARIVEDPK